MKKTFASDNYSGVHPEIMKALISANEGHASSYGADDHTQSAIAAFRAMFGEETEVFFVYNGTGANVIGLTGMLQSFNSIICSELAHINVDESTAPETFTGCKVIPVETKNGKILPHEIEKKIIRIGDQHHPQPRVISISQTTEYGTVYTPAEIKELADLAHAHKMYLHMDGSRISNAAVSLKLKFPDFTKDAGVDVLSFGGTKNGLMFGESVLVFDPQLAINLPYVRKQSMQLHSKMRFIGAQFVALLSNDLWKRNAAHSNRMASRLAEGLQTIPGVSLTQEVQANAVFAQVPPQLIPEMQEFLFFYVWNEKTMEVRLMCSFDTTESEVDGFVEKFRELARNGS